MLKHKFAGFFQIIVSLVTGRIVKNNHKISFRSQKKTLLDLFPWCKQITETDQTEIVDQWSTKHCCSSGCCCNTCNYFQLHLRIVCADFIHKSSHSVNSRITTADHGNCLVFHSLIKSHYTAVYLLSHRCSQKRFSRKMVFYKININSVSNDHITFFKSCSCSSCHSFIRTWSDSYHIDFLFFTQNVSSNLQGQEPLSRPLRPVFSV